MARSLLVCALLLLPAGCTSAPAPSAFMHEFTGAERPWTGEAFDTAPGDFTFAVFADLNGGERPGVFDVAVDQLSLLRPEFILSVGDLIDGASPEPDALTREWDAFDARARRASAPVFRVGGNHDLTGSVLRDVWEKRYGRRYYHFVYKDVLFLAFDTEDLSEARMGEIFEARNRAIAAADRGDPGQDTLEYYRMPERMVGDVGPEQSAYFVDVLGRYPDVRWTMLFMHKPVWTDGRDAEFVAVEQALANRPYTLFNGHLHTMSYTQRNGRDYIMLGTTGGGQSANPMAFDHVTLVNVGEGEPRIAHLRLGGILDKTGHLPQRGDTLVRAGTLR